MDSESIIAEEKTGDADDLRPVRDSAILIFASFDRLRMVSKVEPF